MACHVILADVSGAENPILCYTLTREEAEQIVRDLSERHPDQRFAIVADDDGGTVPLKPESRPWRPGG